MGDLLKDQTIVNALIFTGAALLGQLLHAVKKWAEGDAWLLVNIRRTVAALIANVTAIVGFIMTGALNGIPDVYTVILLGLTMGFSTDSTINKGQRKEWTEEERAAATTLTTGATKP